jgi:ArsR family transcriptional regulator, arsenate/arsenite/antimonite-responsive transcriptional repressor
VFPALRRVTRALDISKIVDILISVDMTATTSRSLSPIACCAPLAAPAVSEEEARATADLFRALADPARVRIVNLLAASGRTVCVCDLVEPLGLAQPTVSHHLKRLLDAGLVEREQRGKWAYFSLAEDAVETLAAITDLKGGAR